MFVCFSLEWMRLQAITLDIDIKNRRNLWFSFHIKHCQSFEIPLNVMCVVCVYIFPIMRWDCIYITNYLPYFLPQIQLHIIFDDIPRIALTSELFQLMFEMHVVKSFDVFFCCCCEYVVWRCVWNYVFCMCTCLELSIIFHFDRNECHYITFIYDKKI